MDGRNSLEITAPTMPAVPPPESSKHRTSRVVDARGTRRTMMRVMQRKSVGMVAGYEQDEKAGATQRTLVFESTSFCTRVTNFPAEWQRLTDDELATLRRAAQQ